jgi:ectoine hydroxylase-related dioxygenase (phytanoyl-CoA dioxygenase family)
MEMGDVIVFHKKTVHASRVNESAQYRVSVDTRWVPTK